MTVNNSSWSLLASLVQNNHEKDQLALLPKPPELFHLLVLQEVCVCVLRLSEMLASQLLFISLEFIVDKGTFFGLFLVFMDCLHSK